jgi:hypothetical protein
MESLLILLDELLECAFDELYKNDQYLLKHVVHERSIVFRFGHYLQNLMDGTGKFQGYDLDFEYNRNGRKPKRIPSHPRNGAFPDLIIHRRGSNKHNLLVMEFKPPWDTETSDDCKKLQQFIDPQGRYNYLCGKSILLGQVRSGIIIKTFLHPDIHR